MEEKLLQIMLNNYRAVLHSSLEGLKYQIPQIELQKVLKSMAVLDARLKEDCILFDK